MRTDFHDQCGHGKYIVLTIHWQWTVDGPKGVSVRWQILLDRFWKLYSKFKTKSTKPCIVLVCVRYVFFCNVVWFKFGKQYFSSIEQNLGLHLCKTTCWDCFCETRAYAYFTPFDMGPCGFWQWQSKVANHGPAFEHPVGFLRTF